MNLETLYRTYKSLLLSVAYRMLGSISEAEDAVQDVFIALREVNLESLLHPKAYLVKMITNHSLNQLKSSKRKRELYVGTWLPEPFITTSAEDPSEELVRQESFGYALLVMLQELTPPERAVFILRESVGFTYEEIAEMLAKTEASCRKLYSRAKAKLDPERPHDVEASPKQAEAYVQAFVKAVESGQFEPFINLLMENAVLFSDGGGKVRAAIFPIVGKKRIVGFIEGIRAKGSLIGELRQVWISGQPGLLLLRESMPPLAFCFQLSADQEHIQSVYVLANPEKLRHIQN
ncbi:RNA polymerase sigma factor SigJ [Paenibacillus cremeus]|uniref:Sigma-70 family RNA polymerase sigma factor n=1 Tax=Paenibacillus cremeus TaxID=2163881 RepID=A0A559K6Q0_9BACL|nr:RNA polymerase sigma factor SigJ [Paenibacillus cremeus]TVY07818.1 sigma-70 family RNA polymerase sigma factor [Paenibacillus cremeus]